MGTSDWLVRRGIRKFIPEGSSIIALEAGHSDVLGTRRKVTAVLTSDALLLATPARTKTILTTVPRSDIRSVELVEPDVADIVFDDYTRAIRRLVKLDLSRHGDRGAMIEQLRVQPA